MAQKAGINAKVEPLASIQGEVGGGGGGPGAGANKKVGCTGNADATDGRVGKKGGGEFMETMEITTMSGRVGNNILRC